MHGRKIQLGALILWAGLSLPLFALAAEPLPEMVQPPQLEQVAPAMAETVEVAPLKEEFAQVELDSFIEQEKSAIAKIGGKKKITMSKPVSFEARLKRLPEERQMPDVSIALELSGVSPLPEVKHRMFIESSDGRIIPVYVEKNTVQKLNAGLKVEESARFLGYHVYSYSKGPAIMVVDFAAIP